MYSIYKKNSYHKIWRVIEKNNDLNPKREKSIIHIREQKQKCWCTPCVNMSGHDGAVPEVTQMKQSVILKTKLRNASGQECISVHAQKAIGRRMKTNRIKKLTLYYHQTVTNFSARSYIIKKKKKKNVKINHAEVLQNMLSRLNRKCHENIKR